MSQKGSGVKKYAVIALLVLGLGSLALLVGPGSGLVERYMIQLEKGSTPPFKAPREYGGAHIPEAYVDEAFLGSLTSLDEHRGRVMATAPTGIHAPKIIHWEESTASKDGTCLDLAMYEAEAMDGETIHMAHLRQCGGDPRPAVLVIPGSGNTGIMDVLGLPGPLEPWYYQDRIGERLALEGFDVYTVELRGYGLAAYDSPVCDDDEKYTQYERVMTCDHILLRERLGTVGIDIGQRMIVDSLQALEFVVSMGHPSVAVGGLSKGSHLAAHVAAYNRDRIDAAFLVSGVVGDVEIGPRGAPDLFNLAQCCGYEDMAVAIAPLPLYGSMSPADSDRFSHEAKTGTIRELISAAYALHGSNVTYVIHDLGHRYHYESLRDFLSEHLY